MMRGRMRSERIEGDLSHVVDEGGFEHPYKLTYAASAGAVDEQTGEVDGAWIIWLPDGCLVIDGEAVDLTSGMTAANNYPSGWYDITDVFDGTDPDDFDLYLDASKDDPKFVIDPDDAENPVLIAKVDGKAVKGVVESAIVLNGGRITAPKKSGLVLSGDDGDDEGDEDEETTSGNVIDLLGRGEDDEFAVREITYDGPDGRKTIKVLATEADGDDSEDSEEDDRQGCNDWADSGRGGVGGGSGSDNGWSSSGLEGDWGGDSCSEINGW